MKLHLLKSSHIYYSALLSFVMLQSAAFLYAQTEKTTDKEKSINKPYEEIPGEYILIFQDTIKSQSLQTAVNLNKAQHAMSPNIVRNTVDFLNNAFPTLDIKYSDFKSITKRRLVVKLDSAEAANARKDKNIKRVIKNYRVKVFSDTATVAAEFPETVDWGVEAVSNGGKNNLTLQNRVWLLDSGVDPNVEDLNVDLELSRSFIPDIDYDEVSGIDEHGTHVAGIIGGKRNGRGIVGVAPNALIVAFKIIHNGYIPEYVYYLDALEAVNREAIPGDVLNLSIQNTPGDQEEQNLIQSIGQKGVKVAIAAGNSSLDIPTYRLYPAFISGINIYTIASYDRDDIFSGFSNFGEPVVYCAPGNHICSTLPGNRYGHMNGTSQATPHVAGLLLIGDILHVQGKIACPSNNLVYKKVHE